MLEYFCFGLHDSDLGFGCFGDSQNITDGAFSWGSGPGHITDRLHSAKYMAVPLIHHPCTGSAVIFTSPIYENTPLPMCSPLSNAGCSISLALLKVQPGFSRCLWFCFSLHKGLLCITAWIGVERVLLKCTAFPSPLWLDSVRSLYSQIIITFLPDWWGMSTITLAWSKSYLGVSSTVTAPSYYFPRTPAHTLSFRTR